MTGLIQTLASYKNRCRSTKLFPPSFAIPTTYTVSTLKRRPKLAPRARRHGAHLLILSASRPTGHRERTGKMPRHLLQQSVDRLAAMAAAPAAMDSGGTSAQTDTVLIVIAVLCFLLCVVGLAMVARCSLLCNPSAFSVDVPGGTPAKAPCGGLEKKALQSLPTVSWRPEQRKEVDEEEGERPECAICLAEFAPGDEVRVLPTCGHGFHAACVDVWLLSNSTCPSCRRALVVAAAQSPAATESPPPQTCCERAEAVAGRCRSSAQ